MQSVGKVALFALKQVKQFSLNLKFLAKKVKEIMKS